MRSIIILLLVFVFQLSNAAEQHYPICAKWDSMCKNAAELVATKCRLGVPVLKETCDALGTSELHPTDNMIEGLPVTAIETGKTTLQILREDGFIE